MAIYTADWLSPRKQRQSHNIEIELPLRHPEIFDAHSLKSCLQDVLKWYTRDNWYFQFRIRSALARSSELTQKLPLELKTQPTEVAL
jgi:hypothetical protein